jgi:phenylacetate-CoA ligase
MNLSEVVRHTSERSPYYGTLLPDLAEFSIEKLPFTTKNDLLKDQAKYPPFGSNLAVRREQISRIHRTSGSTQKPLLLALTAHDIEVVIRAGAAAFRTAGVEKGDIVFNCMNYCMWMGGFTDHLSLEAAGAAVVPYGVGRTENLVQLFLDMDRPSIHSTPSYLSAIKEVLEQKFRKKPRDLRLAKGLFGGESGMQSEAFRRQIEEEWGLRAINANYGLSEALSIMGAECERRNGLHFTAGEDLHVELVAPNLIPVPVAPGAQGELVVTTLSKEAQPLVRYRTGDLIEIVGTACGCGAEGFNFTLIGRTDDMVVVRGINFFPEALRPILTRYSELSGVYTVLVPDGEPVEHIEIVAETRGDTSNDRLISSIIRDVRSELFVTPTIKLVSKLEFSGNKVRLIQRTSRA